MFKYFLKRLGYIVLAVFIISALTFGLLQLAPETILTRSAYSSSPTPTPP